MTNRGWFRLAAWAGFLALTVLLAAPVKGGDTLEGCVPEPASQFAPAGWVCPPRYGVGVASTWAGPGAASNSCPLAVSRLIGCQTVSVRSLDTGLQIIVTPTSWCMCWVGVTGPNGETERLIDLDPATVAALGLDLRDGLWRVLVAPVDGETGLPDTAMTR